MAVRLIPACPARSACESPFWRRDWRSWSPSRVVSHRWDCAGVVTGSAMPARLRESGGSWRAGASAAASSFKSGVTTRPEAKLEAAGDVSGPAREDLPPDPVAQEVTLHRPHQGVVVRRRARAGLSDGPSDDNGLRVRGAGWLVRCAYSGML